MTNGTKNNPIVLNNSNNNKNNLNANESRLKNKYGTRTVQKVKRKILKKELQNAKENRQLTEFKYNLAKPLKIKVSAKKSNNEASLRNVYGDKMVQKVKRSMAKKELQNAKENRQLTEFKYNLAKPLKIKVSAKDAKRIKAQKKSDDYKKLLRKVKFNAPRSLTHITYNLHPRFNEIKNSTYGKNTPESERVKIYEGWVRQLKKSDIKNHRHSHLFTGINPEWINSFIAKLNAEEKAKANAKAKEKANENARKAERKRERDEKRKKKENEKRVKNAIAGLKKLRKN